jgi:hypothetical protein
LRSQPAAEASLVNEIASVCEPLRRGRSTPRSLHAALGTAASSTMRPSTATAMRSAPPHCSPRARTTSRLAAVELNVPVAVALLQTSSARPPEAAESAKRVPPEAASASASASVTVVAASAPAAPASSAAAEPAARRAERIERSIDRSVGALSRRLSRRVNTQPSAGSGVAAAGDPLEACAPRDADADRAALAGSTTR